MKRICIFFIVILFSVSFLISNSYGQALVPPQPETHQRIVEEGYSQEEIQYFVILGVLAIIIPSVFLHPKMRKKFNSYGK